MPIAPGMGEDRVLVRSAAWLLVAAGIVTLMFSWMPGGGVRSVDKLDGAGIIAILTGIGAWVAPWERWHPRASLGLVVVAFALIAFGDAYGVKSPYTYAVYFVVAFTWIGLTHPRRTPLAMAPVAVPFYLFPFLVGGSSDAAGMASTAVTIPVCVLIGETVAWAMEQLSASRAQAEHRALLLRAVVRGTTTITALEADQVLAAVVDSAMGVEMDCAWVAVLSRDATTWEVRHSRGDAAPPVGTGHPVDHGIPALVTASRTALTVRPDDAAVPPACQAMRSILACPVWIDGHLAAVLVAASARRDTTLEDREALSLLAGHCGRTLENAARFGQEREARQILAEVSRRDELTGVGNRRHAIALLDSLQPADAVIMIDIDHFKTVNDSLGHEAGDRVLTALADHLRTGVRDADLVARYGGEEFLVVLRQAGSGATHTADRLCATWRDSGTHTTFSAGVAVHRAGRRPAETVADADAALYAAKRTGRDRVCENRVDASA